MLSKTFMQIVLPISAGVLILLNSCFGECKKVRFSKDDMKWFSYYQLGDKIVFRSSRGEVNEMVVTELEHYLSDCNRFEKSNYQHDIAMLSATFQSTGAIKKYFGFNMEFSKELQTDSSTPCSKYFTVFNLSSSDASREKNRKTEIIFDSVRNQKIETYLFESGKGTFGTSSLKSFNWSKDYGLVRYTYNNGEVYSFYQKK